MCSVRFSGFSPNPRAEEVEAGIAVLQGAVCGLIIAAGGGSAMDTAKCIRYSAGRGILLEVPAYCEEKLAALTASVNTERLKNFPVVLRENEIQGLYQEILSRGLCNGN